MTSKLAYAQLTRSRLQLTPTKPAIRLRALASTMANIHTPVPLLKLNDGTSIPMVRLGLPSVLEMSVF